MAGIGGERQLQLMGARSPDCPSPVVVNGRGSVIIKVKRRSPESLPDPGSGRNTASKPATRRETALKSGSAGHRQMRRTALGVWWERCQPLLYLGSHSNIAASYGKRRIVERRRTYACLLDL